MTISKSSFRNAHGVKLRDRLIADGLKSRTVDRIIDLPSQTVLLEPRRPYREPGAPQDEVIFVRDGLLSIFTADSAGKRQIVALRYPGDGILPGGDRLDYAIQAVMNTTAIIWRAEDFDLVARSSPDVQRYLRRTAERHASIGYQWLVNCGLRDATTRVAHLLCEVAERNVVSDHMDSFINPFTQKQIAEITGQTSVNVNRVFAELEKEGLILRSADRQINVADWQGLRQRGSFEASYLKMEIDQSSEQSREKSAA